MNAIQKLLKKLERVPVRNFIEDAARDSADKIADLNREQLNKGFGADGEKITPKYRNNQYAKKKFASNPKPGLGTPDLKNKGDFQKGIDVGVSSVGIQFEANDVKSTRLLFKYGEVVGLSPASVVKLQRQILLPRIQTNLKSHFRK